MRRFIGAAVMLAGLTVTAVLAQDAPITIKLKKAGAGETTKETKTETGKTKVVVSIMGMDQPKLEDTTASYAFTDEIIERAGPKGSKPTKLKRTYEKAELTKDGAKEDLGLDGKTVMIEKKSDGYVFLVNGKPLTGTAAEILKKEFGAKKETSEEDFLPEKPVKVGDSWKVNVEKAAAELAEGGMVIDPDKSKGTGKLTKVYQKNGKTYGILEVEMDLIVSKIKGPQEIPLKDGSKLNIKITIDGCIDGTEATGGGKMSMKGTLAGELMGVGLSFNIDIGMVGNSVEVKK